MRWLTDQGFQPVLAHPERYLYLREEEYQAFKDAGIQFQRNLGTLEGMYGEASASGRKPWMPKGCMNG
jgi:tyrosine-protein phosphatase YwqE